MAQKPGASRAALLPWWERRRIVVVAALALLAVALDLTGPTWRPLWEDEASSYWTARGSLWAILSGQGTDGTPPLYYLILHAVIRLAGWSEFALRLPSILSAVALVPAVYAVMRRWTSIRVSLLAAGLTAVSPLVHYYAVEARNYALVQLETVAIVYGFALITAMPSRLRPWMLLAGAQTAQLLTHVHGGFFLLAPAAASAVAGAPESRMRRVIGCVLTAVTAVVVSAPWIRLALAGSAAGVGDWIGPWWEAIPPWRALLTSIELFGFGGHFPSYLTYLAVAPSAGVLSIAVSLAIVAMAVAPRRASGGARPGVAPALLVMVALPLLAAWLYSFARQPLYLPGRYDVIVLPPFLMLLAIGLDRALTVRPRAGLAAVGLLVTLAGMSWAPVFGPVASSDERDRAAGMLLAREAAGADDVVSFSLRKPVTAYYAARGGFAGDVRAFPSEVDAHPGWYSADRLREDRNRLTADGASVAAGLVHAARQGHAVWIVGENPTDIDNALLEPLFRDMDVDEAASDRASGLVRLRLR